MQLLSGRVRLSLITSVWLISMVALAMWLGAADQQRLVIAGGPEGSEAFELTSAIAEVLNESARGFDIEVFETGGSTENLQLLEDGRVDLATLQADAVIPDSVMSITSLFPDAYHLVVRTDSDIRQFSDLSGSRIAIPPQTSGQNTSFWFLVDHFGLSEDDMRAEPMTEEAANFAMKYGQVDAVFRVRAPGNTMIRELISDNSVEIVPIEQAEALALQQPAIAPGTIPTGSYRGSPPLPAADLPTAILARLLVAREGLDTQLTYRFTQALYELRSDIQARSRLAGFMVPAERNSVSQGAIHPGALQYYDRNEPGFIQQNARLTSTILYIVVIGISALLALRTQLLKHRRLRMGQFSHRLLSIADQARHTRELAPLMKCKEQLIEMLHQVVRDLDNERVSQEEFEHFSFAWQAVDALVRDQLSLKYRGEAGIDD